MSNIFFLVHPPIYTVVHMVMLHVNKKRDYKHWTEDPRTQGPGTQGPEDLRTQSLEGCVVLQQLQCNLHANGIIYSKQRYFKLSFDLFDPKLKLMAVSL